MRGINFSQFNSSHLVMLKQYAHIQILYTKKNDLKMTVLCSLHQFPLKELWMRNAPRLGVDKKQTKWLHNLVTHCYRTQALPGTNSSPRPLQCHHSATTLSARSWPPLLSCTHHSCKSSLNTFPFTNSSWSRIKDSLQKKAKSLTKIVNTDLLQMVVTEKST